MFSRRHRKSIQIQEDFKDLYENNSTIQQQTPTSLSDKFIFPLIRPPRQIYKEDILVPPITTNNRFTHLEYQIPFKLSLYKTNDMRYVLIYLHGNSSSRLEGHSMLKYMPKGVGLACFDFSACGNRKDRQFVTLGEEESKEVDVVARFLKKEGYTIAGWGRSMGAVSLLLSSEIDVFVVDSPFNSLARICKEIGKKQIPCSCLCCFKCFYPCIFGWIKNLVKERAGLCIQQMEVAQRVKNHARAKNRKIFFVAGLKDTLVPYEHAKQIHKQFEGIKKIRVFQGTHNSIRPRFLINQGFEFIYHHLLLDNPQNAEELSPRKLSKVSSSPKLKIKQKVPKLKTEVAEEIFKVKKIEEPQDLNSFHQFPLNESNQKNIQVVEHQTHQKTEVIH